MNHNDITTDVGNKNKDEFTIACALCGTDAVLTLTAHRNTLGKVTGWIVACTDCQKELGDMNWKLERMNAKSD